MITETEFRALAAKGYNRIPLVLYSFIGLPAKVRLRVKGPHVEVEDARGVIERHDGDPLAFLRAFLGRFRAAPQPGLPRFCGGLAGYFGYDTVRHIEPKLAGHKANEGGPLDDLPDMLLLLTD